MAFTITAIGAAATAIGTNGNDTATLGAFSTLSVEALAGEDFITAGVIASSTVTMDAGNDTVLLSGAVASSLKGGEGIDTFIGTFLSTGATIGGGKGTDTISLSAVLNGSAAKGGKGADTISVGLNSQVSTVAGGKGADTIAVATNAANSIVNGGNGDDNIFVGSNTTLGSSVFGGAGDDAIVAFGFGNVYGEDGNDTITATGFIYGGAGDDEIAIVSNASQYFGGEGADTFGVNATNTTSSAGVIRDYQVGVDAIDLDTGNLSAASGNSSLVFQADTPIAANTTVYELSDALTTGLFTFLTGGNVFVAAGNGTTTATIEFVTYAGGNAQLIWANFSFTTAGVITNVNSTFVNATLNNVAAGSLTAADFV